MESWMATAGVKTRRDGSFCEAQSRTLCFMAPPLAIVPGAVERRDTECVLAATHRTLRLGAITTGCMRPFVPRTNKNETTTQNAAASDATATQTLAE